MWLFTTQGFYSVVAHRRDPGRLIVRARAREDLEVLREQIPELRIYSDPDADYRWRGVVTRAEWVAAVAELATELDYDNFKRAVADRQGRERERLYHRRLGGAARAAALASAPGGGDGAGALRARRRSSALPGLPADDRPAGGAVSLLRLAVPGPERGRDGGAARDRRSRRDRSRAPGLGPERVGRGLSGADRRRRPDRRLRHRLAGKRPRRVRLRHPARPPAAGARARSRCWSCRRRGALLWLHGGPAMAALAVPAWIPLSWAMQGCGVLAAWLDPRAKLRLSHQERPRDPDR